MGPIVRGRTPWLEGAATVTRTFVGRLLPSPQVALPEQCRASESCTEKEQLASPAARLGCRVSSPGLLTGDDPEASSC